MSIGKTELGTKISSLSFAIDIHGTFKSNFDMASSAELS
jgi:hypothetical protein